MRNNRNILIVLGVALSVILITTGAYAYTLKINTQKPLETPQVAQVSTSTVEVVDTEKYYNVIKDYELDMAVNQRTKAEPPQEINVAIVVASATVNKATTQQPVSRSVPSVTTKQTPSYKILEPTADTQSPVVPPTSPPPSTVYDGKTAIMGTSVASVSQLEKLIHNRNPNADYLGNIYMQMEHIYGIRADIAFLQMVKETNALKFTGDVSIAQHNPAGIGAIGGGAQGAYFASWEEGIEAQFQHLLAYVSTKPIPSGRKLFDPRFDLVTRGSAPYVEWLGKANNPNGVGWAWPGDGYGTAIINLLNEALRY